MTSLKLLAVILIVVGLFLFYTAGPNRVLDRKIELGAFTASDVQYGRAFINVLFLSSEEETSFVNAALDINGSSAFEEGEWIIRNTPVRPKENSKHNFYFTTGLPLQGEKLVRVVLTDFPLTEEVWFGTPPPEGREFAEAIVEPELYEAGNLLDLATVTNHTESMKGISPNFISSEQDRPALYALGSRTRATSTAGAQKMRKLPGVIQDGIADLNQQPGECGPTVAANALIALVSRYGNEDQKKLTQDPERLIGSLKEVMHWNKEDGVLPDDFVRGKNEWARQNNLPIETTKVGSQDGIATLNDIRGALQSQQNSIAEIRLTFGDPVTREPVGGHIVNLVGFHEIEGQTYIELNDPASPTGTDTYEVLGNAISNYGPFGGLTVISWGFVETWTKKLL